jgi:hypothetical protein
MICSASHTPGRSAPNDLIQAFQEGLMVLRIGTPKSDDLIGSLDADLTLGLAGADDLAGGRGNDALLGQPGGGSLIGDKKTPSSA